MNTKYTLKNFRVFDEQGAAFELAPVTILTGCNSSGKSSITKSLMLLNPLMSNYKRSILNNEFGYKCVGFSSFDVDFTRGKHNLGNFEKVVNWESKSGEFSVACEVYSIALLRPLTISFTFFSPSNNNGQTLHAAVRKVEISCEEKILYRYCKPILSEEGDKTVETYFNLADWKNEIIKIFHDAQLTITLCNQYDSIQTSRRKNKQEKLEEIWNKLTENNLFLSQEAIRSFLQWQQRHLKKGTANNYDSFKTSNFLFGHLYSLGTLMTELNDVPKERILEYAIERFVNAEGVKGAWYNDENYKQWVIDIFTEYIASEFNLFSDYYAYYENFKLSKVYTNWGSTTINNTDCFLGTGTASPRRYPQRSICFSFIGKKWEEFSPIEKFQCMFYCFQGFGGYKMQAKGGIEELRIPELFIIYEYMSFVCEDILTHCDILTETEFIELDRSNVQRIYSFDTQGTSFNAVLDTYYNIKHSILYGSLSTSEGIKEYSKGTFASKWLANLTDYSGFQLKQAPEGAGYYVYLKRKPSVKGKRVVSLADVGYGITPLISMLIRIEIAICKYLKPDATDRVTICIEEPESNLHPAVQSKLADMFADASARYPVNFILETHSEYLVRKTQVLVAQMAKENSWDEQDLVTKNPFKVYYMPNPEDGKPYDMGYHLNGKFKNKFGKGFLDVADSLALELL